MIYQTFLKFHLGDNLVHLHFLRKLALRYPEHQFVHAALRGYLGQLREMVKDVPSISLIPLEDIKGKAYNGWTRDGRLIWCLPYGGFGDGHPEPRNWSRYFVDWFTHLAGEMGLESPILKQEDMLFDCPAILEEPPQAKNWPCDVLVINAAPGSGQLKAYKQYNKPSSLFNRLFRGGHQIQPNQKDAFLAPVIDRLRMAGHKVVTTHLMILPSAMPSCRPARV